MFNYKGKGECHNVKMVIFVVSISRKKFSILGIMRKKLFTLVFALFVCSMVWAETVEEATARKVALRVAQECIHARQRIVDQEVDLVYVATPQNDPNQGIGVALLGDIDYYVYNLKDDRGFVIVAGDDRVYPVLAYSDHGHFDFHRLPENVRQWLSLYQQQISWAEEHVVITDPSVAAEWEAHLEGDGIGRDRGEVVLRTAQWNQTYPYNQKCPEIEGVTTNTGCGATALAIIMRYHQWPKRVTNGVVEHPLASEHSEWMCQPLNYKEYDWSAMPMEVDGHASSYAQEEVSRLMWEIGANVKTMYSLERCSAFNNFLEQALRDQFGYSPALRGIARRNYSLTEWNNIVRQEIDANRPTIYYGYSKQRGGHFFICDGYKDYYTHINWGWGGMMDGFYVMSVLPGYVAFTENQYMTIGIEKDKGQHPYICLDHVMPPALVQQKAVPVCSMFDLKAWFENSSSCTLNNCWVSAAIFDVKTEEIESLVSPPASIQSLDPYHGYLSKRNPCVIRQVYLQEPLKPSQRLGVVYSTDCQHWYLMKAAPNMGYSFNMKGLVCQRITDFKDPFQGNSPNFLGDLYGNTFSFVWHERRDSNYYVNIAMQSAKEWNELLDVSVEGVSLEFNEEGELYIPKDLCTESFLADGSVLVSFELSFRPLVDSLIEADYEVAVTDREGVEILPVGEGVYRYQSPTGVECMAPSGVSVSVLQGSLRIFTDKAYEAASVYTMDGRIVRVVPLAVGTTVVCLPQGVYVVKVGEKTVKVHL